MPDKPIGLGCHRFHFPFRVCIRPRDQIWRKVGATVTGGQLDHLAYPRVPWSNFQGLCDRSKPELVAALSNSPIFTMPRRWHMSRVREAPSFADCLSAFVTEIPRGPLLSRARLRASAFGLLAKVARGWRQQHRCWHQP